MPVGHDSEDEESAHRASLRHAFELERIAAIWKEKERRTLARMQRAHDRSVARSVQVTALAMEQEERSRTMQAASDADLDAINSRRSAVLCRASQRRRSLSLASLSSLELRQHQHRQDSPGLRLLSEKHGIANSLANDGASTGNGGGSKSADTPADRVKREFRAQRDLRRAAAAKELAARQRIVQLQQDAEARQRRKQELIIRKQREAAVKEIARRQRMEEAHQQLTLERAAKAEHAAARLARLVEVRPGRPSWEVALVSVHLGVFVAVWIFVLSPPLTHHHPCLPPLFKLTLQTTKTKTVDAVREIQAQHTAAAVRRLEAERRYAKAEDQKSVATWIDRMVAQERRAKAKAKEAKVARLRQNVIQQEEARHVAHAAKTRERAEKQARRERAESQRLAAEKRERAHRKAHQLGGRQREDLLESAWASIARKESRERVVEVRTVDDRDCRAVCRD